jgi:hypothetical protein
VFGYNRYMYTFGNPLNYSDPSGHCATLGDGSPDRVNDEECWKWADQYYKSWAVDPNYFSGGNKISADDWWQHIATQEYADADFIKGQLVAFWSPKYQELGVHHEIYNPAPEWHNPVNPAVQLPGQFLAEDALACVHDFPLGCANAADDAAMLTATGAVIACAYVTGGTCLTAAGNISFVSGAFGVAITAYNWRTDGQEATGMDTAVSLTTTGAGLGFGSRAGGLIGAGISIAQRIYDYWTSRQ